MYKIRLPSERYLLPSGKGIWVKLKEFDYSSLYLILDSILEGSSIDLEHIVG